MAQEKLIVKWKESDGAYEEKKSENTCKSFE